MDKTNTHRFIIGIPTNVSALNDLESSGLTWEEIRWEDFEISPSDYARLFALFTDFNRAFDIIIDEYEEEVIPADRIGEAISLTEAYRRRSKNESVVQSADKLLAALTRAKDLNKPVELFF